MNRRRTDGRGVIRGVTRKLRSRDLWVLWEKYPEEEVKTIREGTDPDVLLGILNTY